MIHRLYLFITKFFYYGYAGTKCVDYDASCIHTLIYAHMKRVKKFMYSDKTHLMWNNNVNNKDMRRLAEFVELSRRMSEHEMQAYYNMSKVREAFPKFDITELFEDKDTDYKKAVRSALKKDRINVAQLKKRYYTLLEERVPRFWD